MEQHFLGEPADSAAVRAMYDADLAEGFVMNLTRLWGHQPTLDGDFSALVQASSSAAGLDFRDRGLLVCAAAGATGDSYCSLAWGGRLAGATSPETAAAVLRGDDSDLDERERTLTSWARRVATDPGATTPEDVAALRAVGYDDAQVLAMTLYVALRRAFSTVNAALGARPDRELLDQAPAEVAETVTWGRPVGD